MDSARTRKVFGVKVGGGGEGFLCIVVFSVWQVLNAQGKLWVSFLMKPHMKPGAPHSTMRFRISGAINKAGWAKGGVENISGPRQPGGPGMPGNGRC